MDMDLDKVREVLRASREGRLSRTALLPLSSARRKKPLAELRQRMFQPSDSGNAFDPLADADLALLEWQIRGYVREGRLVIASRNDPSDHLSMPLGVLRHDHITGNPEVTPPLFRSAAISAIQTLLGATKDSFGLDPSRVTAYLSWRGSLAFAGPALRWGCGSWHHLGVARNETTALPEVYYRHPFELRPEHTYVSMDPMLATGGTQLAVIEDLLAQGVPESQIIVVAVISAPEGVDRLLHRFPGLRILTGAQDERLDARAYITPGLGDFGDKFFQEFPEHDALLWRDRGVMNDDALGAFLARLSR